MDKMEEGFGLRGEISIKQKRQGYTINELRIPNMITAVGKTEVSQIILTDTTGSKFDFLGIGSGSGAPALADTAMGNAVLGRINASGTQAGSTATLVGTFGISGTVPIYEYGIFNDLAAGDMLARATGAALNMVSGDQLECTWNIVVG